VEGDESRVSLSLAARTLEQVPRFILHSTGHLSQGLIEIQMCGILLRYIAHIESSSGIDCEQSFTPVESVVIPQHFLAATFPTCRHP
jgi:hypothetical protein